MNLQQITAELNALDPKNPGAWPLYVRITVVVVLMAALAGGGYYQFVTPLLEELAAEQAKEPGLKQTFETKQRKVAALDALKEQLADMERSFGAMLRQLPSKAEIANLLIDISQTRLANSRRSSTRSCRTASSCTARTTRWADSSAASPPCPAS